MDIKAFFKKDIAGLPVWSWVLIGVGGVGLGLYFYRKNKASTSTTDTTTATGDSTSPNDQLSSGYGDYQPAGSNAGNAQPTGATINIGIPATPSNWATTLILANHPVNLYASAGSPGGLPDQVIDTIPSGTNVVATGPEVVGAWNVPNGSELWYPVVYNSKPGYISAADVSNASTNITNQQQQPPQVDMTVKAVIDGPVADTPGGSNVGGKTIGNVKKGDTITLVSMSPTKNKYGTYYNISFKGNTNAWINSKTIGK